MQILKRVYNILDVRQRKIIGALFLMMLLGAALETIGTSLVVPLITVAMNPSQVMENRYLRFVYELLGMKSPGSFLILLVAVLIAIFVIKNLYLYFMYRLQYRYVYRYQYRSAKSVFKLFVSKPYEFYLDSSTPLTLRHISSDVSGVYNLILTILQLSTELIIFLALFILSMTLSTQMTLLMTAIILVILFVNKKVFGPILRRYGQEVVDNNALVTKWLMQAFNGMKETKVLNKEKYFVDQYDRSGDRLSRIQVEQMSLSNIPRLSIETVVMVGILLMVGIFLGSGEDAVANLSRIALLAMVAVRIMPSANRITQAMNNISYYEPCLTAVEKVLAEVHAEGAESFYTSDEPVKALPFTREVRLENISYRYPNTEVDILKDAELTIPIGASIGLIGPSGAGKSTAVDILLGLLKPQKGRITVDGTDISENLPGWYRNIGYVPQMMFMLDDTIRNNIAYGVLPEEVSEKRIWEVLEEAQMDEFVRGLPDGLDTGIGERGMRISGGQRQRIAIARALYNDPEIMIFDEATSALDNDTETAIMDAIERLHGKKTLIIVAHRLTTIEKCDAVFRVENQSLVKVR